MNIKPILGTTNGSKSNEQSNLKNMSEYSFSSPNLSRLSNHADEVMILRNDSCSPTIRTSSPRIKDPLLVNKLKYSASNGKFKDFNADLSNDDLVDDSENPKLAKSAQEKLRKLKEERLRHSVDVGPKETKKEKRLSRSLDFKSVGLVDDPTTNENISPNKYNDLPNKYIEKSKANGVRCKPPKKKAEKFKDTSIDDLYESFHITNTSSSIPKENTNEILNEVSPRERHNKAKELKDYNERLQLDLTSMKSFDSSEILISPNKTYDINSSYGNSTPSSNSTNGLNNSASKTLSPKSSPLDNISPNGIENRKNTFDNNDSIVDNLEVKGASVFDMNAEAKLHDEDIKNLRRIEKKKRMKKKPSDLGSEVSNGKQIYFLYILDFGLKFSYLIKQILFAIYVSAYFSVINYSEMVVFVRLETIKVVFLLHLKNVFNV